MKRPILVATLGYIIGIIVGLYCKFSIVLFYIIGSIIYAIYKILKKTNNKKFNILSIRRYIRYIRIYLNSKVILLLIISSIISNSIVNYKNTQYLKIQESLSSNKIQLEGIVISNKEEKEYYNKYKVKSQYNNIKINFYITVSKREKIEYGDKIIFFGEYERPEISRNYKGFDYAQYLKQLKICGTIKCENAKVLSKNQLNKILLLANKIKNRISLKAYETLDKDCASIFTGLVLGEKVEIEETVQENFKNAGIIHVLAISGLHINYLIIGINIVFKKILGKRNSNFLTIIFLIFYMFITDFTVSITRAGIMGIITIGGKLIHRKSDFYTSVALSLLVTFIYNPFLIQNLGLQLSYLGTIGIVVLYKEILSIFESINIKNKIYKYIIKPKMQNILTKIKEIIATAISVQLIILPVILVNTNTINPYFLISNLLLSICIAPIISMCFIFMIILLMNFYIAEIVSPVVKIGINCINFIAKIGKLPFSKIYIPTPNLVYISIYYLILAILIIMHKIYFIKKPNQTQIRFKNIIALIKIYLRNNKNKIRKVFVFAIILVIMINIVPQKLKIHFLDVGQGDSCFIVTPRNKTILVDGGGSVNSSFDVGEKTLLPYILDRGYKSIDFVIISHFDNDHCRSEY